MNFDLQSLFYKSLPHLKKWWFSILCIPFCWVLAEQYWMALKWDVMFSWRYSYPFLLTPFFFLIDNFLLIIHEAGHTFFGFLGSRFLTILGGTLLEITLPFLIFIYGWWNRNKIVAQLGLLLTAFAWVESSAYAADALTRKMPLIGDLPKSAHDFFNLFNMMGIREYHMEFAWAMYWIGIVTLLLFLFYPLYERKEYQSAEINLEL